MFQTPEIRPTMRPPQGGGFVFHASIITYETRPRLKVVGG